MTTADYNLFPYHEGFVRLLNLWPTVFHEWWITVAVHAQFKDRDVDTHACFLRKVDFYGTQNPITCIFQSCDRNGPAPFWHTVWIQRAADTPAACFAAPGLENWCKNETKEHFCMCVVASAGCSALSRWTRSEGMCKGTHLGMTPLVVFSYSPHYRKKEALTCDQIS